MINSVEFQGFPKIARLSREVIVTEKIDGTNAQILITDYGDLFVGSRTRWITTKDDNHGFAKWVDGNKSDILKLGVGRHFGEWYGNKIQRGYGLPAGDRRLALFNVTRWCLYGKEPDRIQMADPRIEKYQEVLPECIGLVPILWRGIFCTEMIDATLMDLKISGSQAVRGYMNPEGIVVFHTAANVGFKKTIENDGLPKSKIR